MGGRKPGPETQGAGLGRAQPDCNDPVRMAGQNFSRESCPARLVTDPAAGFRQVQLPPVICGGPGVPEIQIQVSQGLITSPRAAKPCPRNQFVRLGKLPSTQEIGHRGKLGPHIQGQGAVARFVGSQRVFIELQALLLNAAKNHRAEMPVANRYGLGPP